MLRNCTAKAMEAAKTETGLAAEAGKAKAQGRTVIERQEQSNTETQLLLQRHSRYSENHYPAGRYI